MEKIIVRPGEEIALGKRGENLARCAVFDISDWVTTYGEGTVHLLHQRNGDKNPYPCVINVKDGIVRWKITDVDVDIAGRGRAEMQYWVGAIRVKSETWVTRSDRTLNNVGPVPEEPAENWLNTMLELGAEAEQNAQAAEDSAISAAGSMDAAADSAKAAATSETNATTQANMAKAYKMDAISARNAAEDAQAAAEQAAAQAATDVESRLQGYADDAEAAKEAAQSAAEGAAEEAAAGVESRLSTYVDDASEAKAGAEAAQKAAELARDEAQGIAGGDFATRAQVEDHTGNKNNPHGVTLDQVGGSNPNLLDNWYFADPINQRGQTEYTLTANYQYTIDRWWGWRVGSVISLSDGGVTLTDKSGSYTSLAQQINATISQLAGKTVTMSVLINGELVSVTGEVYATDADVVFFRTVTSNFRVNFRYTAARGLFFEISALTNSEITLLAAKLELGSVQTLAHQENGNWVLNDPPPDKGMELLKCIQSTAGSADTYANKVIYHTGNKPTAAQIGAVPVNEWGEAFAVRVYAQDEDGMSASMDSSGFASYDRNGQGAYFGGYYEDGVPVIGFYGSDGDEHVRLRFIETPVEDYDAATKGYVDNYAILDGGAQVTGDYTLQGNLNVEANFTARGINVGGRFDLPSSTGQFARMQHAGNGLAISCFKDAEDTNNKVAIKLEPEGDCFFFNKTVDGVTTWRKVYHTGIITAGATDITAGSTSLTTDRYYDVYE